MSGAKVTNSHRVAFLVVTATQDEFNDLVGLLHTPPSYKEPPDAITDVGPYKVAIIKSGQTNAISQAAVADAIKRRDPRAVILTGIAAGFPESGVGFGDIVIPFWIAPYEHAKITDSGGDGAKVKYQHRGLPLDVDVTLWEAAAFLKNDPDCPWAKIPVPRPASPCQLPTVHADHEFKIGSGDKLVASEFAEAREWLLREFGKDALGLEMESFGVSIACRKAARPFLLVKASQDPATSAKDDVSTKDEWRHYAASVAAKFVLTLIERYKFLDSSITGTIGVPIWTHEESNDWNLTLSSEQRAVQDSECAWILRFPQPGRSPLDVDVVYDAENVRFQRYDRTVEGNPLLHNALLDWKSANPDDWLALDAEPWGRHVRLEGVQVKRAHEGRNDEIWLGPAKYVYYLAIHERLAGLNLRELRRHSFANAFELRNPLLLPSDFAIHMGILSKDRFLLLRRRQSNRRTPYSGAWEAGIGEFMHGPASPDKTDIPDINNVSLELLLKRAVEEELDYHEARIEDFTLYGFALERLTLAPKLLVLYRSDATIDTLAAGAVDSHTEDYAYEVDKVPLTAKSIAAICCDSSSFPAWGPTSKLVMMLALTAGLTPSAGRNVIRRVQDFCKGHYSPKVTDWRK
jgi:nucleoside phosphorylase